MISKVPSLTPVTGIVGVGDVAGISECPFTLFLVVLENSNVAKLASPQYLLVHSLPQEDGYDTDDASTRELYPMLVPPSTLGTVQPSRRRQHRASVVDRGAEAQRTAALHGRRPRVLRTGGDPEGSQQAPGRHGHTAGAVSAVGCLRRRPCRYVSCGDQDGPSLPTRGREIGRAHV